MEFLASLFSSQHLVPEQILGKCELRDPQFHVEGDEFTFLINLCLSCFGYSFISVGIVLSRLVLSLP